jgi:hypothetical protein
MALFVNINLRTNTLVYLNEEKKVYKVDMLLMLKNSDEEAK